MAAATSRRKSAGMLLNIVTGLELQEMAVLIRPSRQRRPYASENALSRNCAPSRTRMPSSSAPLAAADSRDVFRAASENECRARSGSRASAGMSRDAASDIATPVCITQRTPALVKERAARPGAAAALAPDDPQASHPEGGQALASMRDVGPRASGRSSTSSSPP